MNVNQYLKKVNKVYKNINILNREIIRLIPLYYTYTDSTTFYFLEHKYEIVKKYDNSYYLRCQDSNVEYSYFNINDFLEIEFDLESLIFLYKYLNNEVMHDLEIPILIESLPNKRFDIKTDISTNRLMTNKGEYWIDYIIGGESEGLFAQYNIERITYLDGVEIKKEPMGNETYISSYDDKQKLIKILLSLIY